MEKYSFLEIEVVEIFEYRKNNNGYWNRAKLHKQVISKAFPIAEVLDLRYSLFFLFDNTTILGNFIYTQSTYLIQVLLDSPKSISECF